MMEFNKPKGIYQQIADRITGRIASGEWKTEERIPSVRDMAVSLGVNPNTVVRSYQHLLDEGLIENRRGIGYFVSSQAPEVIEETVRRQFIEEELPRVFGRMKRLGVNMTKLQELYATYERSCETCGKEIKK